MSGLSPERREELAEALSAYQPWFREGVADAIAPLVADMLAAEREAGAAEAWKAAADWAEQAGWPMNTAAPVLRLRTALNGGE